MSALNLTFWRVRDFCFSCNTKNSKILLTAECQLSATMSPPGIDSLLVLRTITTILVTAPEPTLPSHLPTIAGQLYGSPILDAAQSLVPSAGARGAKGSGDAVVLLNKFKTRVTTLLQSRVSQARWCGVVLAKCAVESSFGALAAWGEVWSKLLMGLVTVRRVHSPAVGTRAVVPLAGQLTD